MIIAPWSLMFGESRGLRKTKIDFKLQLFSPMLISIFLNLMFICLSDSILPQKVILN